MKLKDEARKYPAIEKEMEELRLKCSKREEQCQRMKELQARMEVEEKELDDLLYIVTKEIEDEERRKDDIMEEEEAIDQLQGVIAQNSERIDDLLEAIKAEKTVKQQWEQQDQQNRQILQQFPAYVGKAEKLVKIHELMKKKKLLWQQLWK